MNQTENILLFFTKLAFGHEKPRDVENADWDELLNLSLRQGLTGIVVDGMNRCYEMGKSVGMDFSTKMKWIGTAGRMEQTYRFHHETVQQLSAFYAEHGIKMMVIKGLGLSLNYPVPNHRPTGDVDIYLFGEQKNGDRLMADKLGVNIDNSHHNHSVFSYKGIMIENHYNFVNVYAHRSQRQVDEWLKKEAENAYEEHGFWLPSPQFNALYVLRHAASHFAAQGIALRHVLDWAAFVDKHYDEVDWDLHWKQCMELNMDKFLLAINNICVEHLGFPASKFKTGGNNALKDRMLRDVMAYEHDTSSPSGVIPYIKYRAIKWWSNRWKHRMVYSDSLLSTFIWQMGAHLMKPASLKK